jgi:vacuolar-type H+-ATPase subunit F/Vma7
MNKMTVLTRSDQVDGFRLAGVDAIGVDDIEPVENLVKSWLKRKEEILLAIDDSLFSMLSEELVKQIYASNELVLVTIPDRIVSGGDNSRKKQIYEMIRHATGTQIRFKGETDGE